MKRRQFLSQTLTYSTGIALSASAMPAFASCSQNKFDISLAEWSLHRTLQQGLLTNLEFPAKAVNDFDIHAVEYVNTFFESAKTPYLQQLKERTSDLGVVNVLIMVDNEGDLGSLDDKVRIKAVENHYKWVEAAKYLGCHSIRVNARGEGTAQEVADAAISGLGLLAEYAEKERINIIVENHGGYSSDGQWLSNVIRKVAVVNCGTLPDFGNFCIEYGINPETGQRECLEEYDKYKGVRELMDFAKGVSAKSGDFDEEGNEKNIDYYRMLKIVKDSGYNGYIGIEYSGQQLSEDEGIIATKKLLQKVFQTL
ncbi:MAG: sugar phosphate isomerase/epimerase family protein [Bacteroidota bacterium]